jgi:hypothetical protein
MIKSMKMLVFALFVSAVLGGELDAQANRESPKFTLLLGSNIVVAITIANISDEPIAIAYGRHGRMPDGYQFDVRDEKGASVSKFGNRYVQLPNGNSLQLPARPAGSVIPGGVEIKPGKSMEESATMSDVYPFDPPGRYTIRACRSATIGSPEGPKMMSICSNTILVTVLPKAEDEAPK